MMLRKFLDACRVAALTTLPWTVRFLPVRDRYIFQGESSSLVALHGQLSPLRSDWSGAVGILAEGLQQIAIDKRLIPREHDRLTIAVLDSVFGVGYAKKHIEGDLPPPLRTPRACAN